LTKYDRNPNLNYTKKEEVDFYYKQYAHGHCYKKSSQYQ